MGVKISNNPTKSWVYLGKDGNQYKTLEGSLGLSQEKPIDNALTEKSYGPQNTNVTKDDIKTNMGSNQSSGIESVGQPEEKRGETKTTQEPAQHGIVADIVDSIKKELVSEIKDALKEAILKEFKR